MAPFVKPQWTEQGPGPLFASFPGFSKAAGAIQALATDPIDANRVFVATVGGGVWRSDDAIKATDPTWVPLTDFMPSLSMSAIAFSPLDQNRNTLYAGCGITSHAVPLIGNNFGPRLGIYKTTDGGNTWVELARSVFQNHTVSRILPTGLSTQQGEIILAATDGGLFRSADGGHTWHSTGGFSHASDVALDPSNPMRIYAASAPDIYRSEDGGNTKWTKVTSAKFAALPSRAGIRFSVSPLSDGNGQHWVYAGAATSFGAGLIASKDLGANWIDLGLAPDNGFGSPSNFGTILAASPLEPNIVFCASDAGSPDHWMGTIVGNQTQWTLVEFQGANNTGPHTDGREFAFSADPNVLFEVNDGGIYRLINPHGKQNLAPRKWEEAVGNIRIAEFHSIAYDSVNHVIFGATQDNSIPHQTSPAGTYWMQNEDAWGDGFQVGVDNSLQGASVHYSSQQALFHFNRLTYTSPIQVSSQTGAQLVINGTGGLHLNQVEGAVKDDGSGSTVRWNQSWAVNAGDGSRILLGTNFLYESFDRGDSFNSLGGLAKNKKGEFIPANPLGPVTCYAYGHVSNKDLIYVGAGQALLVRIGNAGLPSVVATYPGATPVDIAVDSTDWRRAYVLDANGHVFRTTDAGATAGGWRNLTANLAHLSTDLRTIELPPRSIVGGSEVIFVAGYGGVFMAEDPENGRFAFWRKHGTNFPNAVVTGIHYSVVDDVLVAGTLGRAAWSLNKLSHTILGEPTLRIHASVKTSCVGGWIEHSSVTFSPVIDGMSDLELPISYKWNLEGGTTASPLDGGKLVVVMPGARKEVVVTLIVTDATGYQMFAVTSNQTIALDVAVSRDALCRLLVKMREIVIYPPYPLGDPAPRAPDVVAPHPWDIAVIPQNYLALREIATQMSDVLGHLIRAEHVIGGRSPNLGGSEVGLTEHALQTESHRGLSASEK